MDQGPLCAPTAGTIIVPRLSNCKIDPLFAGILVRAFGGVAKHLRHGRNEEALIMGQCFEADTKINPNVPEPVVVAFRMINRWIAQNDTTSALTVSRLASVIMRNKRNGMLWRDAKGEWSAAMTDRFADLSGPSAPSKKKATLHELHTRQKEEMNRAWNNSRAKTLILPHAA